MQDEEQSRVLRLAAIQYIKKYHNVEDFTHKLRHILVEETQSH